MLQLLFLGCGKMLGFLTRSSSFGAFRSKWMKKINLLICYWRGLYFIHNDFAILISLLGVIDYIDIFIDLLEI